MTTELLHYYRALDQVNTQELILDRDRPYHQSTVSKPRGLWFSVGDDWDQVCRETGWSYTHDKPLYRLEIDPPEALLHITTRNQLREFHTAYSCETPWASIAVDWQVVADRYSGILIAPHMYEQTDSSLGMGWYGGWDCASGCIWDLSCIRELVDLGRSAPHPDLNILQEDHHESDQYAQEISCEMEDA